MKLHSIQHVHYYLLMAILSVGLLHCEAQCPDKYTEYENRCIRVPDDDSAACSQICAGDTPVCDPSSSLCVVCVEDLNCARNDRDIHCRIDGDYNRCVECIEDADCLDPRYGRCHPESFRCVPCTDYSQCAQFEESTACFEGQCVECTHDGHCDEATEFCSGENFCEQLRQ